jgi:hypothetical protein
MAQLLQLFDANQWDPSQIGGQLPVGKHPVVIINSEVKATKNNDGGYLELELQIVDGPQAGTTGPYRLNLYNANEKAKEIAHKQLSAICHCVGVYNIADSQQLHGIPFIVEVGLQKSPEAQEKGYTEVKKVFDRNGNEPGKQGQQAPAAAPQQPPAAQPQAPGEAGTWPPQNQPQQPAFGGMQNQPPAPVGGAVGAPPWGQPGVQAHAGVSGLPQQQQAPPWAGMQKAA